MKEERIGLFLQRVGARHLVFAGMGYGLLSVSALIILHLVQDSFAPWTHFVSDLGVGFPAAEVLFALLMVVFAVTLFPYYWLLARRFSARGAAGPLAAAAFPFGSLACIAMIPTGLFPLDPSMPTAYAAHTVSGIAMFALLGVTRLTRKD